MIFPPFQYATPSAFESTRDSARLGLAVDPRRPVRFHGRVVRNVPLLRFALRALGEVIWSRDEWTSDGEFMGAVLDPVVTVHPDRIFFEAFSQDQSVAATLIVDRSFFETEGEVRTGTTNIDFTAWLWAALGEMRSSRETWLRVQAGGVEVRTKGFGGRFEKKVEVPDSWVRGFLQLQAGMAFPGTRLSVRPVDLLAAIRYLDHNKANISPRALRYEFLPGKDARLVLEPWEHVVPLVGAGHGYTEERIVRTWGRRRLKLIAPLLPFADRVDVYLKGRAMPSFYAVKLPGLTFLIGLSGWSEQSWTGTGSFDLGSATEASEKLTEAALERIQRGYSLSESELREALGCSAPEAGAALARLCRLGLATYDLEARRYRHRQLFADPIPESQLYPPDPSRRQALEWLAAGRVRVDKCQSEENRKTRKLQTPDGPVTREIIYRDWRIQGAVNDQPAVDLVLNDTGRILFGTCGCTAFREHRLTRGPCAHLIALLQASESLRGDAPSSVEGFVPASPFGSETEPENAQSKDTEGEDG
jgi:hypothetical protein